MKDRITIAHGGGGKLSSKLINDLIISELGNPVLNRLDDSAILSSSSKKLAFTTDSYVVQPIFFKGGDIGKLAVCGTVNDLSVQGAMPKCLSLGLIIEEGLPFDILRKILHSIKLSSIEAKIKVVCGDTKVVEKGSADKIFINTSGFGEIITKSEIGISKIKSGDAVIISGTIGDHGIAVLSERKGIEFHTNLKTDCSPLNGLVKLMINSKAEIHCMRDPTRGGLASVLNDAAKKSKVGIEIDEASVPIKEPVKAACEILGLDPFYIANEGKLVAFVSGKHASKLLKVIKTHKYGKGAKIIGRVSSKNNGHVILNTSVGGSRMLDEFSGEQLPRIC